MGRGHLQYPDIFNLVNKSNLADKIGTLSVERTRQILAGVKLVIEPREIT